MGYTVMKWTVKMGIIDHIQKIFYDTRKSYSKALKQQDVAMVVKNASCEQKQRTGCLFKENIGEFVTYC